MAQNRLAQLGGQIGPLAGMEYVRARGEEGRQRGQESVLSRLSAEAYGAPAEQQRGLVQQAIGVNPEAGFALGKGLDTDRATQMEGLATKARYVVGMAKAGQSQAIAPVYAQLAQEARALGLGEVPTEWNDSFIPGLEQLAQISGTGAGNTVQSQKVGDDGFIYNTFRDGRIVNTGVKADRQMWLRDHPGMAPELVGKDGATRPVGAVAPTQQATRFSNAQGEVIDISQVTDPNVRQQILANPEAFGLAAETGQSLQLPPVNVARARPSEAQNAAEVEAAKLATQIQYGPGMAAVEAEAARQKKEAEAEAERNASAAKKEIQAQDSIDALNEAIALLPGATSGRLEALGSAGLGAVGLSTPGAQKTAQLRLVAAKLIASVPRFEGPQSNIDVQFYREAAGDLANENLPSQTRLAAARKMLQLAEKYVSKEQPSGQVSGFRILD